MPLYVDRARRIRENARYVNFTVLVWGPGDPGSTAQPDRLKAYAKRRQIQDVLKKEFPRAEVHFSEDPLMVQISQVISGQLRKEAFQAKASDLVLMLDISRGADLELDYFIPKYPWFRDKVYVFLPERFVPPNGLVKEIFDYIPKHQVRGFSQKDFEDCIVATQYALEAAEGAAIAKYLEGRD